MVELLKRSKPLSVSPLKASATMGASLAFLGINGATSMLHGAQGCTAYGKVFLISHFREPMPLQTSAMDQVSSVMGADDNVIDGLTNIAKKLKPALIGVPTTGLSETQGTDIQRLVADFRKAHPEYDHIPVVPVETPDYVGSMETGFAKAVKAMIEHLVPEQADRMAPHDSTAVNVLVNASLSPGDVEELKEIVEGFGLVPTLVPDLSESLDGHLDDTDFSPVTTGGTNPSAFAKLHQARATLVIGDSLYEAANLLAKRTGVPDHRFGHLMGIDAMDRFITCLSELSGRSVPTKITRQRRQLQDAMLDAHFYLGMTKMALAAEPDHMAGLCALLNGMGATITTAIVPTNAASLKKLALEDVKIGDLEDLELLAKQRGADLVIGNSHCAASAEMLGIPHFRTGFPQYDRLGAPAQLSIGYRGSRRILFELSNLLIEAEPHMLHAYRSVYAGTIAGRRANA